MKRLRDLLTYGNFFSTISTHDGCCETIANYGGINKIFVCLFKKYPGNEEIIVRLAYIVGNLVANFDNTRITVTILNYWVIKNN